MRSTPRPTGRDSRRLVLTQEAVDLLDQELRKWWEHSYEYRESTGKRKILSRPRKAEKLGLDAKTVDRIYRHQPLTESVLRTAFSALDITPPFSKARYCVLTPPTSGYLPEVFHSCIGRKAETSKIKALLESYRLVTLIGAGGIGKTRLAIHAAEKVQNYYTDSVWFVKLAGLPEAADRALITQAIATTLGVKEERNRPLIEALCDFLQGKNLLLILDNCEHLLEGCAALIDPLLSSSSALRVLATSRERLNLASEIPFRVPSLAVPDLERLSEKEAEKRMEGYDSVKLFIERAQVPRPHFALTKANASVLASICRRLDGIPLAIELAAARMGAMPIEELERRLSHSLHILTRGDRAAPLRHQTLQATIDWSHDLLDEKSKALLRRLSVFVDGWRMEAAEQVCARHGMEALEILDLLTSLVEKNLVVFEEQEEPPRYRLLETIRQYAREKLQESGELEWVRQQHQRFYLALVEEAASHLEGKEQGEWLRQLEAEYENLRAALNGSLAEEDPGSVLRFCGVLCSFWWSRGYISEGRQWCAWALAKGVSHEQTSERARTLSGAGNLAYLQGDYTDARALYEQSLILFQEIGDRKRLAYALVGLGHITSNQTDYTNARTLYEQALAISEEIGDYGGMARSYNGLGNVTHSQGDYGSALSWYRKGLVLFREIGDQGNIANSLRNLGNLTIAIGDYVPATSYFEESLIICREIGERSGVAYSLKFLGNIAQAQGDYPTARRLYDESLTIFQELGDRAGTANSLVSLGGLSELQGDYRAARSAYEQSLTIFRKIGSASLIVLSMEGLGHLTFKEDRLERAVVLLGAAEALRQKIGISLLPREQETHDHTLRQARQGLGKEAFATAWKQGYSMSMEQALEYIREEAG